MDKQELLALATKCQATGQTLVLKGAQNHSISQAKDGVDFLDIAAALRTLATKETDR